VPEFPPASEKAHGRQMRPQPPLFLPILTN